MEENGSMGNRIDRRDYIYCDDELLFEDGLDYYRNILIIIYKK